MIMTTPIVWRSRLDKGELGFANGLKSNIPAPNTATYHPTTPNTAELSLKTKNIVHNATRISGPAVRSPLLPFRVPRAQKKKAAAKSTPVNTQAAHVRALMALPRTQLREYHRIARIGW